MSDNVIKSAGRVFEILEFFRQRRSPLNVKDIAENFGYPVSSTAVLLKSIVTLGYLAYDNELKCYFPTVRVALMGDWIWGAKYNQMALQTVVNDLAKLTGDTVVLAVQNDVYSEYAHIAQGTRTIQFYAPAGARRPLCMSGTGWAMLATVGDDEVARQVRRSNARGDLTGKADLDFVLAQVRQARKAGYAFSRDVVNQGAGVIAVPLQLNPACGRYAIGVAGVVAELNDREHEIVRWLQGIVSSYEESAGAAGLSAAG